MYWCASAGGKNVEVFDRTFQPLDHLLVASGDRDLQNVVADGRRQNDVLIDAATRLEEEELMLSDVGFAQPVQFFHAAIELLIEFLAHVSFRVLLVAARSRDGNDRDLRIGRRRSGKFQHQNVAVARSRQSDWAQTRVGRNLEGEVEIFVGVTIRRKMRLLGIAGIVGASCQRRTLRRRFRLAE